MANINPRARGGDSLSATLAARRRREEQLGRQRVVIPKPPPPVAAAFGVIGTTLGYSNSYISDLRTIEFVSWTFYENNWPGGGGPSCVALGGDAPEFNVVQPGWYLAHAEIGFSISASGGVPPFVDLELNGRSTANTDANTNERSVLIAEGGSWTLYRKLHTGHFYHPGASAAANYLNVAISFPSTPGVVVEAAECRYIIDRVF